MKVNKHFSTLLFFWTSGWALLAVFGAGCGAPARNAEKKVFYYNESDGVATLDPAFAKNRSIMWVIHQLYST
ncbi:MAG TPA: hypothetical protein VKU83_02695, partial [Puia sp.]|nr:hypothetical protein [Puia sp.]